MEQHPYDDLEPENRVDRLTEGSRGVSPTVTPGDTGPGDEAATDGPAHRAARAALAGARGEETRSTATGGSIPVVDRPAQAAPRAEVPLSGARGAQCDPHASSERVPFCEPRNTVLAEPPLLRGLAAARAAGTEDRGAA